MKHLLIAAVAVLSLVSNSPASEAKWMTDYAQALELAKKENKAVLLDFTGSDWCGWCMKMKEETLDTASFKSYSQSNLVLVEVDFPHDKRQTEKIKQQNKSLAQKYDVHGYPCFLLLGADEKELGRQSGYLEGGPGAFIAKLNTWHKPAPEAAKPKPGSEFDSFFKKPKTTP